MDTTWSPLADYFWIAGIDSVSYNDPPPNFASFASFANAGETTTSNGTESPQLDATIEEGSEGESPKPLDGSSPSKAAARHSRNNSWNRLSRGTSDLRTSVISFDESEASKSNRSSATIRAVPPIGGGEDVNGNGTGKGGAPRLGDFDFDSALLKFASARENFLDDLSFSAGAPLQNRAPMTSPRAERLKIGDGDGPGGLSGKKSPMRSVGGSIRRKISFRDMSSAKRQPSTINRSSTINRTSKFFLTKGLGVALWDVLFMAHHLP